MNNFILNGNASGEVAASLAQAGYDPGAFRPWKGRDGKSYVTLVKRDRRGDPILHDSYSANEMAKKRGLTLNAAQLDSMVGTPIRQNYLSANAATLTRDAWKQLDTAVITQARPVLQAWNDLAAANSFTIPDGMGKTVLEYQDMTDIGPATVSMDGLREGDSDRPVFDLKGLPLPITHKDFHFSERQIRVSRSGNMPVDTTNAGLAGRKVAEEIELTTLGISEQMVRYAGYDTYGYLNFPARLTYQITAPTAAGYTPEDTKNDVLRMKQLAKDNYHNGPYRLYVSSAWDQYMDDDYKNERGDTLRNRLERIDRVSSPTTLDFLPGFSMILIQQTPEVARAVTAMSLTTLQWPTKGGMQQNFKVMAIMVPQLRADAVGQTGIVHGAP